MGKWCFIPLEYGRLLRNQVVVLRIEVARPAPELEGKPGPESRIVTSGIEVPTGTPRSPDGTLHPLLHLRLECLLSLGSHLDGPQVPPVYRAQAVQDVCDLSFDHVDHRIVTQTGVWANQQEQIGEPRDGRPKIGARASMPAVSE